MSLEQIVIENIKRIRKQKHITQERLAEYCETSVSYIGLMETYKNIPKLSTIERIAQALGVPVLDLFAELPAPNGENIAKIEHDEGRNLKLRVTLKNEILKRLGGYLDELLKII